MDLPSSGQRLRHDRHAKASYSTVTTTDGRRRKAARATTCQLLADTARPHAGRSPTRVVVLHAATASVRTKPGWHNTCMVYRVRPAA